MEKTRTPCSECKFLVVGKRYYNKADNYRFAVCSYFCEFASVSRYKKEECSFWEPINGKTTSTNT